MAAWQITRKDLLLLLKDRRAVVLLLVLPLLFISIVGMSTGQFLTRNEQAQRFRIVTVVASESDVASDVLQALGKHSEFLITAAPTADVARETLRRGDASLMLQFGPEFEARVEELRLSDLFSSDGRLSGGPAALDVTFESRPATRGLARLLEGVIFSQIVKVVAPVAARKHPLTRNWVNDSDAVSPTIAAAAVDAEPAKTGAAYSWIVPGFTVMFAFFVISVMARSFLAERENGTLRRLRMAPISPVSILLGKTLPFFLTSVLQCLLLFACGRILFGMSWGPQPVYLIPVILCTSLAATSLGLLLATLVHSDQQVSSYGTALILILSSLSGCFFPREMFPPSMKQASLLTPHGWALRAFDAVLSQASVDPLTIAACCAMLVLFAGIFFAAGTWRFRTVA